MDKSDFSTGIDLQCVLLGDFNFPDVCWATVLSRHSDEQFLLDFISDELLFTQIIDSPTHKHGNILDLIFCSTADLWDFEIKFPVISDHYAINLKSEVEYVSKNSGCCFSSSSFDPEWLRKFLPLTRTFACRSYEISADFIPECYHLLDFAKQKSRKRREVPFYYSTTTMHCLNKLSTARKQHNFPKVRDLENELANWIEIDKHFLLAKTCKFSTNTFQKK